MELTDIHARLLSCFTQNVTIERWSCEIDDVIERIFQEVKEPIDAAEKIADLWVDLTPIQRDALMERLSKEPD